MGFKETFFKSVGTNSFSGITFGNWLRILRDNRCSVNAPYWPRATLISLLSLSNSVTALAEHLVYCQAVKRTEVQSPLFVLGTWRSGTTHLHNLLAVDRRFAFPNLFQVTYPLTFLLTERIAASMFFRAAPTRRPQDAVKMGVNEPQEEDFAMCADGGQSVMLAWAFPRNAEHYHPFMTLSDLSASDLSRWKNSHQLFLKKLTYKYRRPLVLKSPANTGRVKTLFELYPSAKLVHIHRHPYDIFRSHLHTLHTCGPYWQLQRKDYRDEEALHTQIIEFVRTLYESYFEQRALIPPDRLHDVAYAELERDPIGQIRGVYAALALPDFGAVEQPLRAYVSSLADYKKNAFAELPVSLRNRIYREWRPYFDEWDYAA